MSWMHTDPPNMTDKNFGCFTTNGMRTPEAPNCSENTVD